MSFTATPAGITNTPAPSNITTPMPTLVELPEGATPGVTTNNWRDVQVWVVGGIGRGAGMLKAYTFHQRLRDKRAFSEYSVSPIHYTTLL